MLSVSGLTKRFEDLAVMEGFDLNLCRGGFTTLIGPSGCGKSTLFDILTGVFPKDGGRISWLGEDLPDLMGRAAYMPQKVHWLYEHPYITCGMRLLASLGGRNTPPS